MIPIFLLIYFLNFYSLFSEEYAYFDLVYQSHVYDSYLQKLRIFADQELASKPILKSLLNSPSAFTTSLEKKGFSLIQKIINFKPKTPEDKKEFQNLTIKKIRELIALKHHSSTPLEKEIAEFVDNFTLWLFSEVDLFDSIEIFFTESVNMDNDLRNASVDVLWQTLFQHIEELPQFSLRKNVKTHGHDPYRQGDIPTKLYVLDNQPHTKVMRLANVVREETEGDLKVNEEFVNYLRVCKDLGKKHLYINLIHRVGKSVLIENLEKREDLSSFYVVTLDKNSNSAFYRQSDAYEELDEAALFKEAVFDNLFNGEDFYWSCKIDLQQWQSTCKEIVEEVHREYFSSRPILLHSERCDFIEIV
jgi:hypothetical protein